MKVMKKIIKIIRKINEIGTLVLDIFLRVCGISNLFSFFYVSLLRLLLNVLFLFYHYIWCIYVLASTTPCGIMFAFCRFFKRFDDFLLIIYRMFFSVFIFFQLHSPPKNPSVVSSAGVVVVVVVANELHLLCDHRNSVRCFCIIIFLQMQIFPFF